MYKGRGGVLVETGTQTWGEYINRQKTTVAEWVALRPVYEVCEKETGYDGGGKHCDPWRRQGIL